MVWMSMTDKLSVSLILLRDQCCNKDSLNILGVAVINLLLVGNVSQLSTKLGLDPIPSSLSQSEKLPYAI